MALKSGFFLSVIIGGALVSSAAFAETAPIALTSHKPVATEIDSFPRLPESHPAAKAINKALDAADARVAKTAKECTDGQKYAGWERKIDVTMAGPRFVSYVATDNYECGGPHPNTSRVVLVFDLSAKKPVDWLTILPAALHAKAELTTASDESRLGVVKSDRLNALYIKDVAAQQADDSDCAGVLDDHSFSFMIWPDATSRSLVFDQDDLPRVVMACGGSMSIPLEKLKAGGFAKELTDALANAAPPAK